MLFGSKYRTGDVVMYMCRVGFLPVKNPPRLTCQSNGQWDGEAVCVGESTDSFILENLD